MAKKDNSEKLNHLRHSAAHLLAAAVLRLWPDAKPTIGPAIEDGFYYDFDFGDTKVSEDDLPKIEKEMQKAVRDWKSFERIEVSGKEARERYKNNPYKVELIDEFEKKGEVILLYKAGDFVDLCRGGHIDNPDEKLKHFKLLSVAGAYWRGSEKNPMLTRIYGTVWSTEKELKEHLNQLEEAKKRDHRKIGRELELFMFSEEVGPGLPLWLPNGTIIKEELEKFAKEVERKHGYQRISTPHLAKEGLYITSGHLPYYAGDMFPPMEVEGEKYYVKPMNCPHAHMIYKFRPRSYRELPIRFAEFGTVYRYEDSGTLMGLMRVRGHTTNDAHIYCTEEQVVDGLVSVLKLHEFYYKLFDIKDFWVELALPDFKKKKDKYFDDPKAWEKAIELLRKAAKKSGIRTQEQEGTAAFYGPKFDFNIKSAIGREFGASTNQLDFGSGKRFNLTYIDSDGKEKVIPYIIHRAPLGSDERFIAFLTEHYAGAFPVWLSPVQAVVIPITDRNREYAQKVMRQLSGEGIRVELDDRSETLQARIRDAQIQKIPYMLVAGDKEEKENAVSLRLRTEEDLGSVSIDKFLERVRKVIADKRSL